MIGMVLPRRHQPRGLDVPELDGAIEAPRSEVLAVGADRHTEDRVRMGKFAEVLVAPPLQVMPLPAPPLRGALVQRPLGSPPVIGLQFSCRCLDLLKVQGLL